MVKRTNERYYCATSTVREPVLLLQSAAQRLDGVRRPDRAYLPGQRPESDFCMPFPTKG